MSLETELGGSGDNRVTWSIDVVDVHTGAKHLSHSPRTLLSTASLGKVFVLLDAANRIAADPRVGRTMLHRDASLRVTDSGIWQALSQPTLSVADAAALVGAVSDNWATNALIDFLTLDAVQQRASESAPLGSTIHDYVRDSRSGSDPVRLSSGCAEDFTALMTALWSAPDTIPARQVLDWLSRNTDLSMVAIATLLDPLAHVEADQADGELRLWNKTGSDVTVRADAGIVAGTRTTIAYAAIANWATDAPDCRAEVMSTMRSVGERVVELVN